MAIYGLSNSISKLLDWIGSGIELYKARNSVRMSEGDRFDRFTRRACKVLSLAQEEAQRLRHSYIGTEHLLLGLMREGEGVAGKVLTDFGIDLAKVRQAVEGTLGHGDHIVFGEIGLTPHAKKAIELAVDEARLLNHDYIGTEHLLLGLLHEEDERGSGILESLGLRSQEMRAKIMQIISK